ncbi:MAG: hypothetical protein GEV10_22805 [Streptosporangiales bacterium]|nr:hypothetical protein [Streptosporangiales bacterium]
MTLTVSSLRVIDPAQFLSFGFHAAEPYVANASEYFDSDVARVIAGGQAWSGEGQPQAVTVTGTNSLALRISTLQMRAGKAAMDGLYSAITSAQRELTSVEADATAKYDIWRLDEEGTLEYVKLDESPALGSEGSYSYTPPDMTARLEDPELTFRAQALLEYARSADLTATALLTRIINTCPAFRGNASPRALAYNTAMVALAHANVDLAEWVRDLWADTPASSWGGEITSESDAFWDGILNGVGVDILTEAPDGKTVVDALGRRIVIPLGIGTILYEGYSGMDPDDRIPDLDGPTSMLPLGPGVDDSDLADIIEDYALDPTSLAAAAGLGTLAEAARLQRANPSQPLDEDYVDEARDLRDELDAWLNGSYSELADGVDIRYIQVEASIAGGSTQTVTVEAPLTLDYYDPEDFAVSPEDREAARQLRNQLDRVLDG